MVDVFFSILCLLLTNQSWNKMLLKLTQDRLLLEFEPPSEPPSGTDSVSSTSAASSANSPRPAARTPPRSHQAPVRQVQLTREKYGGFGFAIRGGHEPNQPIVVCAINRNSPADRSRSLFVGDRLLVVNGQSLHASSHEQAVRLLKQAGQMLTMLVQPNSFAERPAALTRWKAAQSPATRTCAICWCEQCTTKSAFLTEQRNSSHSSSPSVKKPAVTFEDVDNLLRSTTNSSARVADSPFCRAQSAKHHWATITVTSRTPRNYSLQQSNKENLSNSVNTPVHQPTPPPHSRRSVRFRSLWRSACTTKQNEQSSPQSPQLTPKSTVAAEQSIHTITNSTTPCNTTDTTLLSTVHSLQQSVPKPKLNKQLARFQRLDSLDYLEPLNQHSHRRMLSPLRAGGQPTCRTVPLLHCQLTRFINCTHNVRRNGFVLRWPSSQQRATECGPYCSVLLNCSDAESARTLYETFDEYVRLLRRRAIHAVNCETGNVAPSKRLHHYGWAVVNMCNNSGTMKSFSNGGSTISSAMSSSNWKPMYVLLRGGQLNLHEQPPEGLSSSSNGNDSGDLDLCQMKLSSMKDSLWQQLDQQIAIQFDKLGQLLSQSAVRCTFTCGCCADPVSRCSHNLLDVATDAAVRSHSKSHSINGHSSPDSTLGCSIGSSVSSSLGGAHSSSTPPPLPPPKSASKVAGRNLNSSDLSANHHRISTRRTLSAALTSAPLQSLHAHQTLIRRLRCDELLDHRDNCVLVVSTQPHCQLYLGCENEHHVTELLAAWPATTHASVQQVTVSVFAHSSSLSC